jgi:hypothetical protein
MLLRLSYFLLTPIRRNNLFFEPPPASTITPPAAAPVSATSPLGVLTHAKGEAGHLP